MSKQLGVVMDPIEGINIKKDSTFAMLLAAQARGWTIHYMQPADLYAQGDQVYAAMTPLKVKQDSKNWFSKDKTQDKKLSTLDVILMRKDPPFDMEYIYTTYLLELAEQQGVLVVNKPQSLRDANEKLFTAWFPDCCPPTLVTRNTERLQQFIQSHQDTILKPLEGMGGQSVFRVGETDPNKQVIIETLTDQGQRYIMAQQFIPDIHKTGDKRILLINGEPIPYGLARIPAQGETRGNLAVGAKGIGIELTERDRWICERVGPTLREKGLVFVGIDIIGDYLTEINVTSPTCIREIEAAFDIDIATQLVTCMESML